MTISKISVLAKSVLAQFFVQDFSSDLVNVFEKSVLAKSLLAKFFVQDFSSDLVNVFENPY